MKWELYVSPPARKRYLRFPNADQRRIADALRELQADPYGASQVKQLGAKSTHFRRRAVNYRIFYETLQNYENIPRLIHVTDIRRRTSTTY